MIRAGLDYLLREFSVTREEWRRHFHGGDMLLDGLLSKGYATTQHDRFAVSRAGLRYLAEEGA